MREELNKRAKQLDLAVNKVAVSLPQALETRHAIDPVLRLSSSGAVHSRWACRGLPRAGMPNDVLYTSTFENQHLEFASFGIRNSSFDISPTDTFRHVQHPDLCADTATRASAKPKPRSHLAGLLRSERHLFANLPFNDSDWFRN